MTGSLFAQPATQATAPATASAPASQPPADPQRATKLLAEGRALLNNHKAVEAAEALAAAVGCDPESLECRYWLASALSESRPAEALAEFRKTLALAEVHPDGAEARKWKDRTLRTMATTWPFLAQWDRLRRTYADRFRQLAGPSGNLPSGVNALRAASVLAPEDARSAEELVEAVKRLPASLPATRGAEDTAAAKALIEQASVLAKKAEHAEAVKLLEQAVTLCRGAESLAPLAEEYLACGKPAEAARTADEAHACIGEGQDLADKSLGASVERVLRTADPNHARVEALRGQLLASAESLIASASKAKDRGTGCAIVEVLSALSYSPVCLCRLKDAAAGRVSPPWLLDLTQHLAEKRGVPSGGPDTLRVGTTARTMEFSAIRTAESRWGVGSTITFQKEGKPLRCGRSMRFRWQVEQLKPDPKSQKEGNATMSMPWGQFHIYYADRMARVAPVYGKSLLPYSPKARQEAFSVSGRYVVDFVKDDLEAAVYLDGRPMLHVRISEKEDQTLASLGLYAVFHAIPANGEAVQLRLTLLEAAISPDCLEPPGNP